LILIDTSGLLAALFPDQTQHEACRAVMEQIPGPYVVSPFVLAELDYLISKFAGQDAEMAFLDDVAAGAYLLPPFSAHDVDRAREAIQGFGDLHIGLADASIVVLSERFETLDVLTLDERHFRVLRGFADRPFCILPADS